MSTALRVAPLIFVAAVFQVGAIAGSRILGAEADLLLVTVIVVALVAGSITGAVAGFAGGLLVDVMTLDTLGTTSIVLTVAGYWAGRYGETTGRGRPYAALMRWSIETVMSENCSRLTTLLSIPAGVATRLARWPSRFRGSRAGSRALAPGTTLAYTRAMRRIVRY